MRIISRSTLKTFWEKHPASEEPLKTWFKITSGAQWKTPADVKACYGSADILKDGRVIFDIGGNKYRIVAWINYDFGVVYIRFVGTHRQYDAIDAQTV
ncbi:MAG: type II toxin-antitoxin system HigB family toxin [bacterium]|nr:type II toxin-antitoxin system HigB family toxin [bacterium]